MAKSKRIVFIIPSLLAGGGAERVITELANYASLQTGLDVHLIILAKTKMFYTVSENVTIHEPGFDYKKYSRIIFTLKSILFLRGKIAEIKPDAVLSFEEMYNSFVLLSTLFQPYKVFVSDRSKPDKDWGFLHNNLRKILYRTANGIIAQTEYARAFLRAQTGNRNIGVIGNPIRKVNEVQAAFHPKENIILNVGRLIKTKQQGLLMEFFSKMDYKNWKLYIVGDGPEMEALIKKRKELSLEQYVVFPGNISDVDDYYRRAKIFAFTSISEGYPNALGEAMTARMACLSFDCIAGPSDLIEHGVNGFLLGQDDHGTYIQKLQHLMLNEDLRRSIADRAYESIKQNDISIIGNQYLNFLLNENKKIS
jgi:glycosyltransferase involved in cell wall biosynthesis